MSQDLFAAFGSEPAIPTAGSNASNVDDDDFGDFEDASVTAEPEVLQTNNVTLKHDSHGQRQAIQRQEPNLLPPRNTQLSGPIKAASNRVDAGGHPFAGRMDLLFEAGDDEYDAGADELSDLATNPEAAMAYSKRIIAEQEAAQAKNEDVKYMPPKVAPAKSLERKITSSHSRNTSNLDSGPKKLRKKSGYVPAREPEVLFDAENMSEHESGFDDFGGFESEANGSKGGVTPIASVERSGPMPPIDLLGLDDTPHVPRTTEGYLKSHTPQAATSRPVFKDDELWDDFETAAPTSPQPNTASFSHTHTAAQRRTSSNAKEPNTSLPPTNIPPPSVLLSLYPSLFASADEALFHTMAKLDLKQRQILLAHPASHEFLKRYLNLCVALAHIIAGRRLRWKRDQHLSQSMRIGPSAVGGKSGMKLAGVDKSELTKEDREVVDTIGLWKGQVGKLRTAATTASSAPGLPKLPSVPDISEQMPVRTLKQSEGGISAAHACALCGLRREERVAKVDVEVEDSFGEWWVQGTSMHVACTRFWDEFEKKLKSR